MEIKEFVEKLDQNQLHIYCFSNNHEYYAFDYYNLILVHTNKIINEILESMQSPNEFNRVFSKYNYPDYEQYWNNIINCFQSNIFISEENLIQNNGEGEIGLISFPTIHDCNLNCTYCFAKAGTNHMGLERVFSEERIRKLFDFIYSDYFRDKISLRLDLVSGGEPLLRFDTLKKIVEIRNEMQKKYCKDMMIWLCTNGTLLNEEICDFLNANNISIGISIDGEKHVHDANRCFKNGEGTYETIIDKINFIKQNPKYSSKFKDVWGLTVITPKTESIVGVLKHHKQLGINNVQMKLVRSDKAEFIFNEDDLEHLKEKYNELCEFFFKECIKGNFDYIKMILNDNDYLGKIIRRLLLRQIVSNRCQAGKTKVAATANGNLYPCDSFVGIDDFIIGNYCEETKINNPFKHLYCKDRDKCRGCWGRFLCGGDCYHNSFLKNGDINIPDEKFCDLQKYLITLSIRLIDELNEKAPNTIKELTRFLQLKNKINA